MLGHNPTQSYWSQASSEGRQRNRNVLKAAAKTKVRCAKCHEMYTELGIDNHTAHCMGVKRPQGHTLCVMPGCARHVPFGAPRCYQHEERTPDILQLDAVANRADQTPRAGKNWQTRSTLRQAVELLRSEGMIA